MAVGGEHANAVLSPWSSRNGYRRVIAVVSRSTTEKVLDRSGLSGKRHTYVLLSSYVIAVFLSTIFMHHMVRVKNTRTGR